ncbi:solute carrier family 22 member 8 isoform X2 [Neovison vison]|uniref:solute carrier family 22 member 8 isoform X2 n=1 Tax=Neovison vison TaxID=452646 RepID=UPI001CF0A302|nr:solute carrier family 22 member 8 isoform X2 [Neogale vison]
MAFSELMDRVGSKGTFQYLNMVLLGLPVLGLANHYLLQIFTAATPPHHCRLPPNASAGPWGLPKGLDGKPETCLRFIYPPNTSLPNNTQGATEPCLDGWVYDLHTVDSIVTEWDLVCDSRRMKEVAQSVFMAGTLIGGIVLGDLSDRFGRKPILTCSYLLLAASGSGAAFSPNLSIYTIFRFLSGWSISGIVLSTTILNVECVSIQMRAIMSTLMGYFYTCGQFILPGLAYAIPQWRWLQLTVSIPFFVFFLLSWWIPESVRWVVLSGKFSKALKILRWMAALNGKKEEGEKLSVEDLKFSMQKEISLAKAKYSMADLFRTPNLRRVTFCLSLVWFSTGFGYYSLAMSVEDFGVNLYVLQLIFGGVDIPAKFIAVLSMNHLGRHITQAGALLLAGGAILAITFVPSDLTQPGQSMVVSGQCEGSLWDGAWPADIAKRKASWHGKTTELSTQGRPHNLLPPRPWKSHVYIDVYLPTLRTVLAVFGKGCLSSSFSCLFLYTTELYPTVIRYGRKQHVDPCGKHVGPTGENHGGVTALHPQCYIWDRHPPWRQCRLLPA